MNPIQVGTTVQTYCHQFGERPTKTARVINVVIDDMSGETVVQMKTGGGDRLDVTEAFFRRAYIQQRRAV